MTFEENSKITNSVKELVRTVYEEGYKQGMLHAQLDEETPQQKRDRIVEQAERDIEELKDAEGSITRRKGYRSINGWIHDAEFIVNAEKRTVVCLLIPQMSKDVSSRGIAKCAPSDCFNSHIGKAIALRRALGLEVPEEYMNAPNPTEVRVGDVVQNKKYGHLVGTVTRFEPTIDSLSIGKAFRHTHDKGWLGDKQVKIIDDSRYQK